MFNTMRQRFEERFQRNFVFIHINKTAGSSIQAALGIPHEHKTAIEKRDFLGSTFWNKKFRFTFVRNPWDKVVSHYHYRVQTNQTGLRDGEVNFNEWVQLAYGDKNQKYYDKPKMFMPQSAWIEDESGQLLVDYIGRYENLQDDFAVICERINKKSLSLPHMKKSSRGDYQRFYSAASKDIVEQHFRHDIEAFDYTF